MSSIGGAGAVYRASTGGRDQGNAFNFLFSSSSRSLPARAAPRGRS
jgi:hypothetical protein